MKGISTQIIQFIVAFFDVMFIMCFVYISGVFACCNGDTWASELGTVLSKSEPFLITTWKRVPKGTNGGISLIGTLASTVGGLLIGITQYLILYYFSDSMLWAYAPPQWPILLFGALSGFLGSLIDSILGGTLQYSGMSAIYYSLILGSSNLKWSDSANIFYLGFSFLTLF